MEQNPTTQKREKRECYCVFCESRDKDMKEFYVVRIGGLKVKQRTEASEVFEEFSKAKAEGRQPLCPYCHKLLEIGQFHSVYVRWKWNDKKKGYEQEEPDWDGDAPFCDACEEKDWDFTDNDLVV